MHFFSIARLRLDLGVRSLLPEWRALLSPRGLAGDVLAGVTVACIAVPLSLAIALASGVPPATGLVSAIVAGVVCALFGGSRLAVSGPAAAMAVLIASVVERHGLAGLLVVGCGCGLLQLATGVLGLGRVVRLVPSPVVEGFTAGIGAIILVGQLPRALGLPAPPESHVFDVVAHIGDLLYQTRPAALAVAAVSLGSILALERLSKRIPAHLVAVAVPALAVALLGLGLETIGEIPRSLPPPRLPSLPEGSGLAALAGSTLLVFALASLESLLSSSAVDKLTGGRSDPDQELIGQGLGNLCVALVGGLPVTSVIARSGANVQAGAKTRRASVVHALVVLATVFALAPVMGRIPVAALAGLLIAVALKMLSPAKLVALYRVSRGDALTFAATFLVIVLVGLLEGIQWGVLAALAIAALKAARARAAIEGPAAGEGPYRVRLSGPLTFLSTLELDRVRERLGRLDPRRDVVLDMHEVTQLDASGSESVAALFDELHGRGVNVIMTGLGPSLRAVMLSSASAPHAGRIAATELEASRMLGAPSSLPPYARLARGVERFRLETRPRYAALFRELAAGQSPHTLFVACADSRLSPNLLTSSGPGELFIVRNVGNMIGPFAPGQAVTGAADVEYAVGVLGVREIVVCGHSSCGAVRALARGGADGPGLESLRSWLQLTRARELFASAEPGAAVDDLARRNARAQLDHLMTYPVVAAKVRAGELALHAWFFDIGSGDVEAWSDVDRRWAPLAGGETPGGHDLGARAA
ncbi:MAG TPA: bifunctional SulP family inorganic anion transporter/carbonic anhydrase [Polyangiaceae bacterium]|nr:bifunctional SulP family inorganic anion transporter/carbonic anhydrase [Polyangiaceae bacterium]